MKRVFSTVILIIMLIILLPNSIYAIDANLSIIETTAGTRYLENDQGYISKNIVDSNREEGSVTIEVKLSNTSKNLLKSSEAEVFLVVDNSYSMNTVINNNKTRKKMVVEAMQQFISEVNTNNYKVKIGLIKIGTNANLVCGLTNDLEKISNSITNFENMKTESATNIANGITVAKENFSKNSTNKIMILLTDGLPTHANISSTNIDDVVNNTKDELLSAAASGIDMVSIVTDISDNLINTIFGSTESPTAGKFYNISAETIQSTITNDIFKDVMNTMQNPIKNILITDYFSSDLNENFLFTYVEKPNIGTVNHEVENNNVKLVWSINQLEGKQEAILKYKIVLKSEYSQDILNKEIRTNDKLELSYTDYSNIRSVILENSPKIKFTSNNINISDNTLLGDNTLQNNVNNAGGLINLDPTRRMESLPLVGKGVILIIIISGITFIAFILWNKNMKYKGIK